MTINEFSGIITALSTISMAVVAGYALHTWRKEFIGKRKIELACQIMKSVYDVQDAILYARIGRINELDIKEVERWVNSEKQRDPEHMGVFPKRFHFWIPHRRLAERQDKLENLQNYMNDACLYWGLDLMKLIFELNEFSLKIRTAAKDLYYNDTPQDPAVLENILFSNDPNDEINKRINEIVEEIKINLEPIYKDKQFKWKKQRLSDFAKIGIVCNCPKFCIFQHKTSLP